MNAPVRKGRGAGFWLLIAGGGIGACCVLPVAGLFMLGIIGSLAETPSSSSTSASAGASSSSTGSVAVASGPDDFLYVSPGNGMTWIAENHVSAEGVAVTLAGEWREEHRNIILRLRDNGTYGLEDSGSVTYVNRDSGSFNHADSVRDAERGKWTFADGVLTLTPEGRRLDATTGLQNLGSEEQKAVDGPRAWSVVGVTIEYTPHDAPAPKTRPGIHIVGPSPTWYYPPGTWDMVLRSAPFSG